MAKSTCDQPPERTACSTNIPPAQRMYRLPDECTACLTIESKKKSLTRHDGFGSHAVTKWGTDGKWEKDLHIYMNLPSLTTPCKQPPELIIAHPRPKNSPHTCIFRQRPLLPHQQIRQSLHWHLYYITQSSQINGVPKPLAPSSSGLLWSVLGQWGCGKAICFCLVSSFPFRCHLYLPRIAKTVDNIFKIIEVKRTAYPSTAFMPIPYHIGNAKDRVGRG